MGHAAHFLTRIERLSALQADVALALYRDPGLVHFILGCVRLPEGAERVALALEHADSPHIIVTRSGAFVTCLAAGMSLSTTPVISRAQLDQVSDKFEVVRTGLKRAEDGEESERLIGLLMNGGGALAREDFALLRMIMPVLGSHLLKAARERAGQLDKQRREYRRSHYRLRGAAVRDVLRLYWEQVWAMGHLTALCCSFVEDLPESVSEAERAQFTWGMRPVIEVTLTTLTPATVLRAAWGAARIGRMFLPEYYERLKVSVSFTQVTHVLVVLLSVGLMHESVRAEISEAVAQNLTRVEALADAQMSANERKVWAWIHGHGCQMLAGHKYDEYVAYQRKNGAQRIIELGARLPAGHAQRWDEPEQVPDELAMSALPTYDESMMLPNERRITPFLALPWVVNAAPDELYVPARFIEMYGGAFDIDRTREMLDRYARYHWIGQPALAKARPGRNEPCTCGSGKKYKRCCGAGA